MKEHVDCPLSSLERNWCWHRGIWVVFWQMSKFQTCENKNISIRSAGCDDAVGKKSNDWGKIKSFILLLLPLDSVPVWWNRGATKRAEAVLLIRVVSPSLENCETLFALYNCIGQSVDPILCKARQIFEETMIYLSLVFCILGEYRVIVWPTAILICNV